MRRSDRSRRGAPAIDLPALLDGLLERSRSFPAGGFEFTGQLDDGKHPYCSVTRVRHGDRQYVLKSNRMDKAIQERDAHLVASLAPGVVELLAWFEGDAAAARGLDKEQGHLVLELFTGKSLLQIARDGDTLTLRQMQTILRQVFAALYVAPVEHHDLHAGNVMFNHVTGEVRLIDFGASRIGLAAASDIGYLHNSMDRAGVYAAISDLDEPHNQEAKREFNALRTLMRSGTTDADACLTHRFFELELQ